MSKKFTRTIKSTKIEMIDVETKKVIDTFEMSGSYAISKLIRQTAKKVGHNAFYPIETEQSEVREMDIETFMEHSTVVEKNDEPQAPAEA